MRLIDLNQIVLPSKNEETFRKVDLSALYHYEFEKFQAFKLSNLNLQEVAHTQHHESPLFDIAPALQAPQYTLTLTEDVKEPILLDYTMQEDETLFAHALKIIVKKGVKATLIETFKSKSQNSAFIANTHFELEESAQLIYAKIEDIKNSNSLLSNTAVSQKKNSHLEISNFEYGDGFTVNTYENRLQHPEAKYDLNALVRLENEAYHANLINTLHENKHAQSNIKIKHSLKHRATAVFKAKTMVDQNALFSKAFQNSETILLSDDASIFAQPHLEICIDELEASHGATTGTLDKEQLLYLQARGIHEALAHKMLLEAFEAEIYHRISDERVKEKIEAYEGDDDV